MSKTVMIPADDTLFVCTINGNKYAYKGGTTQTVPDEVAELIEMIERAKPAERDDLGEDGQVLTHEGYGVTWRDVPAELPEGGSEGQVLTRSSGGGLEWSALPVSAYPATEDAAGIIAALVAAGLMVAPAGD